MKLNWTQLLRGLVLCLWIGASLSPGLNAQALAWADPSLPPADHPQQAQEELVDVLNRLSANKQVRFVYESKVVTGKYVSNQVNYNVSVEKILGRILPPLGLEFQSLKHQTFAILPGNQALPQRQRSQAALPKLEAPALTSSNENRQGQSYQGLSPLQMRPVTVAAPTDFTVSGLVLGIDNQPLEGATVREKGGTKGSLTDAAGRYSITLEDGNGTLLYSYVGYKTQEIAINGRNSINVTLSEDLTDLDEVVVVGYGTQVRREITGNIATVKGEDLQKVPFSSVDQGLQGMAAGVQVSAASGVAGAPVRVMIRGTSSINAGTEPLYVIDGMIVGSSLGTDIRSADASPQNPLANINPNDVASIEILKDAAATAIYGSRGSNGVILITTKSGKTGKGELNISYNGGVQSLLAHPRDFFLQNGNEWLDLVDEARANTGLDAIVDDQFFTRQDLYSSNEPSFTLTPEQARQNSANWDEMLNTGRFHDVNISTSRGFDGGNYFISANYRDETGVLNNPTTGDGNRFQRLAVRVNADLKPFSSFTLGTRTTLSYTNNERINPGGGGGPGGNVFTATPGFGIASSHRPIYPIFDPGTGELFDPRSGNNFRATMDGDNIRNQAYTYRALSGFFAEWQVPWIDGLSFRSDVSADVQVGQGIFWSNTVVREQSPYAFDDQRTGVNVLFNALANYRKEFGDHTLALTAGTERQFRSFRSKYIEGDNLFGTAQEVGSPGNIQRLGGFANTGPNFLSFFGRASYNFAGKYLVGISFRRDASTAFLVNGASEIAPETWSNFPGASVGWILSEESFMQGQNIINFLKLRGSYGRTGNAGIPGGLDVTRFADWGRYGSRDNNVNGGSLLSNIAAVGITWETTDAMDVGFDYELLNSRLSGSLAYFQQDVTGLILQVPVPPSSGIFNGGSVWSNIGNMRNSGLEFSLTSYNVSTPDFTWQTSLNFTWNTNEVLELAPVLDENENGVNAGATTTVAGGILGEFFLARYAGLNEFGGYPQIYEIDGNRFLEDGVTPNPEFRQETGNILPADRNTIRRHKQRTGKSGLPKYFGGFNNTLNYKGIELTFNFAFQGGNWIFDDMERQFSRIGGGGSNYLASLATDNFDVAGVNARHPGLTWNNRYDTYNEDGTIDRTNQRFDYRGNQYHDQYLKRGDFIRLRTLQLAYNFPNAVLERMNLRNLRVFVTGTNLLTITGYDGLDPEQAVLSGNRNLTQGFFGLQMPPLRVFSGGLSVNF